MVRIIQRLYQWEVLRYLFFGALTVIVNLASFYVFTEYFAWDTNFSNICSIILALLFAYITNATFVFHHNSTTETNHFLQFRKFIGLRSITMMLEVAGVWLLVDILRLNSMLIKLILQAIIIVLNYIFSKLFVFQK